MPIRWVLWLMSALLGPAAALAQPLTVSAAASLQDAMREIGKSFSAQHPGVELNFNFASSGVLLTQIAQGAPVDVYASADQETMNRAMSRRLIDPSTRAEFAGNELVLISPASRPASLGTLRDLLRSDVRRIAVGSVASVPAGRYAKAALDSQRLWATLTPKLVFAENVRQVLAYVGRAEVEAGFVYRSDASQATDKVRIDLVVPMAQPVLYPIARVASSTQPVLAGQFIAFVKSAPAQAVLARHGFTSP
jgi:molybdate transport system substrate-binding protein